MTPGCGKVQARTINQGCSCYLLRSALPCYWQTDTVSQRSGRLPYNIYQIVPKTEVDSGSSSGDAWCDIHLNLLNGRSFFVDARASNGLWYYGVVASPYTTGSLAGYLRVYFRYQRLRSELFPFGGCWDGRLAPRGTMAWSSTRGRASPVLVNANCGLCCPGVKLCSQVTTPTQRRRHQLQTDHKRIVVSWRGHAQEWWILPATICGAGFNYRARSIFRHPRYKGERWRSRSHLNHCFRLSPNDCRLMCIQTPGCAIIQVRPSHAFHRASWEPEICTCYMFEKSQCTTTSSDAPSVDSYHSHHPYSISGPLRDIHWPANSSLHRPTDPAVQPGNRSSDSSAKRLNRATDSPINYPSEKTNAQPWEGVKQYVMSANFWGLYFSCVAAICCLWWGCHSCQLSEALEISGKPIKLTDRHVLLIGNSTYGTQMSNLSVHRDYVCYKRRQKNVWEPRAQKGLV